MFCLQDGDIPVGEDPNAVWYAMIDEIEAWVCYADDDRKWHALASAWVDTLKIVRRDTPDFEHSLQACPYLYHLKTLRQESLLGT